MHQTENNCIEPSLVFNHKKFCVSRDQQIAKRWWMPHHWKQSRSGCKGLWAPWCGRRHLCILQRSRTRWHQLKWCYDSKTRKTRCTFLCTAVFFMEVLKYTYRSDLQFKDPLWNGFHFLPSVQIITSSSQRKYRIPITPKAQGFAVSWTQILEKNLSWKRLFHC